MPKYELEYWFEHGGICIWGLNQSAQDKFNYAIETASLPISSLLIAEINKLEDEYCTYLDCSYPPNPSPWTKEHKKDFIKRANMAYKKLCKELGSDYNVENKAAFCIYD